jgi:hypothetical protein
VQQVMLGADRDPVRLDRGDLAADGDLGLGVQPVADPAKPDLPGAQHAWCAAQGALGLIDQLWVDGVHQPPVNLAGRLPQHAQEQHRDRQADKRVGPVPAQRHAARPGQHPQ